MSYRPEVAVDDPKARAAFTIYATLLGGSMGSRLFDEIREQRGLCYSVYATDHAYADVPVLQLGSGLESAKCVEAYTRMREIVAELAADGPDARGGRARARVRRGAPRPGLREHQRGRALRGQPADRLRRGHRPRRGDRPARRGHLRRGRRGGPHGRPREARGGLRRPARQRRVLILLRPWPGARPVGQNGARDGGRGPQRARALPLRLARERPLAAGARAARRRARRRRARRGAAARARAGVRRRARLGVLRRRAVAGARLPVRRAVGRGRDGRSRRRALLHAAGVRAQARDACRSCAGSATRESTCWHA